jgi:predicted dehydrogenase
MMLDAMAAGKHIYVEKPMTLNIAEGKMLCDAAKKSGKVVMVGSQNKTSTMTAKAREVVKSGVLGKVNMVRLATYRNRVHPAAFRRIAGTTRNCRARARLRVQRKRAGK